jgi:hypothetical protein
MNTPQTHVNSEVSEKPRTIADCTAAINSLIKSGNFKTGTDCMAIMDLIKRSCAFQNDTQLANFAVIAQHDMGGDSSDSAEDDPEYRRAMKELQEAGVDVAKMRKCFLACPIIREQVITAMAFKGQM